MYTACIETANKKIASQVNIIIDLQNVLLSYQTFDRRSEGQGKKRQSFHVSLRGTNPNPMLEEKNVNNL